MKFVEPETMNGWAYEYVDGKLAGFEIVRDDPEEQPARIIREKDYQRLLNLAKKGHAVRGSE